MAEAPDPGAPAFVPAAPGPASSSNATAAEPASAPPRDADPFLRFRLRTLPLYVVPGCALLGILGWTLTPSPGPARLAHSGEAATLGFYIGVAIWALVEARLRGVAPGLLALFRPAPRPGHALEGAAITAFHLVYELGALISLAWLVSLAAPGFVQMVLDRLNRMTALETHLTPLGRAMSFAGVVVLGPVCEELIFRGVLFHRFAARWGIRRGLLVTGLLFGLLHGERAAGVLTFGLLMGLLYVRSGTLLLPVLCHTLNNGFAWGMQALDTGPHETFTLVTLQQAARPWVGVLAITAPFVLLYFARRWPARDERLRWPEAPAITATG